VTSATPLEEPFAARFAQRWREISERSRALVGLSLAQRISLLPKREREAVFAALAPLDWQRVQFDWDVWARPKQRAPAGDWDVWTSCGGRGVGKTRAIAEWVRSRIETGRAKEVALVGPTFGDVRKVMIGGRERVVDGGNGSGLLDIMPPWVEARYNETRGEVFFPKFHCIAYTVSAEKPEFVGRNPDTVWADEPIIWPHPEKLFEHLFLSNRKRGKSRPQMGISTTPRPLQFLRELIMDPMTVTVRSSTWENAANLAQAYIARLKRTLAGTRLGQQELEADMLGDNPDALFALSTIEAHRALEAPVLDRVGVGIDPAVSDLRKSDKHGIVAAGRLGSSSDGHLYVLADKSLKGKPEEWGEVAWTLLEDVEGSFFVVERNRSGDLAASNLAHVGVQRGYTRETPRPSDGQNCKHVLRRGSRRVVIVDVLAMGDKAQRAEPLSTIYEKGRSHHVGRIAGLEDEMTEWDPKTTVSPNSLDALVHVSAELLSFADEPARESDHLREMVAAAEANSRLNQRSQSETPSHWLSVSAGSRRSI